MNTSGLVQSSDAYNAYGQRLSGNPGGDEFGFGGQAGYRTDPETGLCLLGQRYYDPSAGRFLNRDPAGYAGGMDLYAYTGDDPVNFMDPMGLDYDDGDPNTPNTFGGWVDHFGFNDSVANFGTTVGEADAGCATLGDELLAGGKVAGYGALLFVPGGEEARGAEIGANLADDGARDLAEDAARGCDRCLVAGTPVQMADGSSEPIQDVQAGQQVLSRDPATGKDAVKTVTATVQRPADALVTLSLSDPQSGKSETLTCTPEHPLYVSGRGWVEAGDLGIGTSIVTRAGPPLVVEGVRWQRDQTGSHPFTVYNLTVADDHTYFAGDLDGGLWAHNIDCDLYGDVGGHHIHAKAAFRGAANYDKDAAMSVSQADMAANGLVHQDMTNMQRQLFDDLASSGAANTIGAQNRIAYEALRAGGASEEEAASLVMRSLNNLTQQGVTGPSRIPWH